MNTTILVCLYPQILKLPAYLEKTAIDCFETLFIANFFHLGEIWLIETCGKLGEKSFLFLGGKLKLSPN